MSSRIAKQFGSLVLAAIFLTSCNDGSDDLATHSSVVTGAVAMQATGFSMLSGQRVGLIANQTSRVGESHLVDVLRDHPDVELAAILAPEHGFRGEVEAGFAIDDAIEMAIPVFSLYGDNRAPTKEMLDDVDVLVFDIQDIGARFYTYISTLGLAMQAAAQYGKRFVVLDRPNPLGGELVEGPMLEEDRKSFVGLYPIPIVHGMTVGELARMIQGEGMLEGLDELQLEVVEMQGWQRDMKWTETGLTWIATSPNIPDFDSAVVYPGVCFLEATTLNEGRGTVTPFRLFGAPDLANVPIVEQLRLSGFDGLKFDTLTYVPVSIPGAAENPRFRDTPIPGVRIDVVSSAVAPVRLGVEMMTALRDHDSSGQFLAGINERWLGQLTGSGYLFEALRAGATSAEIMDAWEDDVISFIELRQPYLLY